MNGPAPGRLDEPGEVRDEDRIDPARLAAYLTSALPGGGRPIALRQFRNGHSNLTYLVTMGGEEAVLRRAPRGAAIKSAHDMRREFNVLSALQGVYPKAPRPILYCGDESVLGAPFYLMARVQGVILRGNAAPVGLDLGPERMRRLSAALVDDLAALHTVEVRSGPLAALGKPEGYVARQVRGWSERYFNAKTDEVRQVEEVAAWLARQQPPESGAALIHNDYKYDNLVLDPADLTRIAAVLDWEMSTVGDPLMDLGTTLGYWVDPDDREELRRLAFGPTMLPGNLSRVELAERYAAAGGRAGGERPFYYVFALFKIAVIVQQIYRRFRDGHTTDARFAGFIDAVRVLGGQAARAIERERIYQLS